MGFDLDGSGTSRYLQVYEHYKELILSGQMEPGRKLPSIRACAAQLQLSRTTVEAAYLLLAAEGYIVSRPQSGYYVTEFFAPGGRPAAWTETEEGKKKPELRYDFASSSVDRDSFQFDVWRRYIKSALRQDERLLSYGEPQGERELREALCGYVNRNRNVICTPDSIVVGAGVQSLLHILCPMLKERTVCFYNPQFRQGRTIFEDYGFTVEELRENPGSWKAEHTSCSGNPEEEDGLREPSGGVYYVTPSQMTVWGDVMHIKERTALLREAAGKGRLIIEDDYNSEFRYFNRPIPALQSLSGGRGVVYLGTFSKLLLPSIRISYMVLPPHLLKAYRERGHYYNQTASKAEQIALCQFIRDGHMESQLRKARKLYASKAKVLCREIERVFGEKAAVHPGEAGFLVLAKLKTSLTASEVAARALKAGVAVRPVEEEAPVSGKKESTSGKREDASGPRILLSCASMGTERYAEALEALYGAVYGKRG